MSVHPDKKTTKAKEIAKSALIMFARKGYAFTSIEQISSEAGIGKSTVYEYFRTKEELFVAAIMEGAHEWIADMEAIGSETQDPVERLYRIAELYTEKQASEWKPDSRLFIEVLSQTFLQNINTIIKIFSRLPTLYFSQFVYHRHTSGTTQRISRMCAT